MNFVLGSFKSFFLTGLLVLSFFSALPCQGLASRKSLQTLKKNVSSQKYSAPIVIDKNHFEFRSDSAYLKGGNGLF